MMDHQASLRKYVLRIWKWTRVNLGVAIPELKKTGLDQDSNQDLLNYWSKILIIAPIAK